jgi:4-diphosphocytidyl-2-C-methyl-D-erythritol kinase
VPLPAPELAGERSARTVAQAKINLVLRVLAREASGFHQIETVFQRLDLGDTVTVRIGSAGRSLDCRGADVGPVERNLAWRAASAYVERAGWPKGFAVEIEKTIPVGGGLGGGSADAGAVLRCLDALAPAPLGAGELLALAAPLGSDVPFLASDAPRALAWGRGQRMLALPALPARRVQLAVFEAGVDTAAAYAALAAQRGDGGARGGAGVQLLTADDVGSWDAAVRMAANDFEDVVLAERADVRAVRAAYAECAATLGGAHGSRSFALMSGSGATVFLVAPGDASAADLASVADVLRGRAGVRSVATATALRVAAVERAD